MIAEIACEGAPRDLGFDQGRACRDELRRAFGQQPARRRWRQRLGVATARTAPLVRDLRRHFPQHSEFLEGLAHGTGLPYAWFAERLARELGSEQPTAVGRAAALALGPGLANQGSGLARSFACAPLVRRSRPDGGFAAVELTLPWLSAALAGVNEGGLAALSVACGGASAAGGCAAPAPLLAQDCLARFETVGGAVDWCSGRPAGGRARILLADACGEIAAVDIDGAVRRRPDPEGGLIVAGDVVAAAVRAGAPLAQPDVAKILGGRVACIDPAGRRLALFDGDSAAPRWLPVAPPGAGSR